MTRSVIAFLVAPLAAPVLLIPYIRSMTTTSTLFVFALIISAVIAYAGVFIFGVPAYLLIRTRGLCVTAAAAGLYGAAA
jgi:hypothetical protein